MKEDEAIMAFNNMYNGFNAGYGFNNQYGYVPNQQTQVTPPTYNNRYEFVNGYEGAVAFPLQPTQSILLVDNLGPIVYKKTVDGFGQPTLKAYRLVEFEPNAQNQNGQPTTQNQELPEYALKKDLEAINEKLDTFIKNTRPQKSSKE